MRALVRRPTLILAALAAFVVTALIALAMWADITIAKSMMDNGSFCEILAPVALMYLVFLL